MLFCMHCQTWVVICGQENGGQENMGHVRIIGLIKGRVITLGFKLLFKDSLCPFILTASVSHRGLSCGRGSMGREKMGE